MENKRTLSLVLPLKVVLPRKTKEDRVWILNLNNYRNAHYTTLNTLKIAYGDCVLKALAESEWDGEPFLKARLTMRYFHGSGGRVDKSNPCSVIEKFACDALTEAGVWYDDNSAVIPITVFEFAGVDKENPRCEFIIEEI